MARTTYTGRHRLGIPGLVHCHEMLNSAARRHQRRWFGFLSGRGRHEGQPVQARPGLGSSPRYAG